MQPDEAVEIVSGGGTDRFRTIVADYGFTNAPESVSFFVGSWRGSTTERHAILYAMKDDGRWVVASTVYNSFGDVPEYVVSDEVLPKGADWFLADPAVQVFSPYITTWFRKDGDYVICTFLTAVGAHCEFNMDESGWYYKRS